MQVLRLTTICLIYSVCSAYMLQGTYENKMDNPNFDLMQAYHPSDKRLSFNYGNRDCSKVIGGSYNECGIRNDLDEIKDCEFWCAKG